MPSQVPPSPNLQEGPGASSGWERDPEDVPDKAARPGRTGPIAGSGPYWKIQRAQEQANQGERPGRTARPETRIRKAAGVRRQSAFSRPHFPLHKYLVPAQRFDRENLNHGPF